MARTSEHETLLDLIYQMRINQMKTHRERHGMRTVSNTHPLYRAWHSMTQRCNNKNDKRYKNYGGRGIKVCSEWESFINFKNDMFPTWSKGLSLDRINNNNGYSKDNCRWATRSTQSRNTRVLMSRNKSGYRGVSLHSAVDKYRARISVDRVQIHLGHYDTALEAAKAYDKYVIENNLEHTINGVL